MGLQAKYSNLPILQNLPPEDRDLLLSMANEVRFNAEELILRDSDVAADFYILVQGWVTIEMDISGIDLSADTSMEVLVSSFEPVQKVEATVLRSGEPFGEMAFLEQKRRSADVRALTSVTALQWNAEELNALLESNHRLGYLFMRNLATLLARRIRDVNLKWRRTL